MRFLRKRKVIEFSRNKEISDRKFINFWGTNKTKQTIKKKEGTRRTNYFSFKFTIYALELFTGHLDILLTNYATGTYWINAIATICCAKYTRLTSVMCVKWKQEEVFVSIHSRELSLCQLLKTWNWLNFTGLLFFKWSNVLYRRRLRQIGASSDPGQYT